jgi:hypothetical protein
LFLLNVPHRVSRKWGQDAIVQQLNILQIAAKHAISKLLTKSVIGLNL